MKKRFCLILSALLLILLLCGCTDNEIICGMDPDNTAYLRYELHFDLSGLDDDMKKQVRGGVYRLTSDYTYSRGFTCKSNWTDNSADMLDVSMERREPAEDLAGGIEALQTLLTDARLTPFTAAGADLFANDHVSTARVEVLLQADKILDTAAIDSFPKALREQLTDALNRARLKLCLTLPATELPEGETAELSDGLARKTVEAELLGGDLSLSLAAMQTTAAPQTGRELLGELNAEARSQTEHRNAALVAGAILLLLAVLLFTLGSLRKQKPYQNTQTETLNNGGT